MKRILGTMIVLCALVCNNTVALAFEPLQHREQHCKECQSYSSEQLFKARRAGVFEPVYPREAPHVWLGHTFEKCRYCQKIAAQKSEYPKLIDVYHYRLRKAIIPETFSKGEMATYRLLDESALGRVEFQYFEKTSLENIRKMLKLFDREFKLVAVDEVKKIVMLEHRKFD